MSCVVGGLYFNLVFPMSEQEPECSDAEWEAMVNAMGDDECCPEAQLMEDFARAPREGPTPPPSPMAQEAESPRILRPSPGRQRLDLVGFLRGRRERREIMDEAGDAPPIQVQEEDDDLGGPPQIPRMTLEGTDLAPDYAVRYGLKFANDTQVAAPDPDDLLADFDLDAKLIVLGAPKGKDGLFPTHAHIKRREYNERLRQFNTNAGYYQPLDMWVHAGPLGNCVFLSGLSADRLYDQVWGWGNGLKGQEYVSFFSYVKKDNRARVITIIDPSRYGEANLPDDVMAQKTYFLAESVAYPFKIAMSTERCNEVLDTWLDLTYSITSCRPEHGENIDHASYILDYLADIVQNKFRRPNVAVIIYGRKGAGKDFWMNQFLFHVIGREFARSYPDEVQFWAIHDVGRLGAIVVGVEELSAVACRANHGKLQSLITSDQQTVNPKGKPEIRFSNHMRLIATTNNPSCVDRKMGERRYFQCIADARYKDDADYWVNTAALLYDDRAGYIIYRYLMERDIHSFNPRCFPRSEMAEGLDAADVSLIEQWATQWSPSDPLAWHSPSEAHSFYFDWCIREQAMERKAIDAVWKFTQDILGLVGQKRFVEKKPISSKNMFRPLAGADDGRGAAAAAAQGGGTPGYVAPRAAVAPGGFYAGGGAGAGAGAGMGARFGGGGMGAGAGAGAGGYRG